MAKQTAAIVLGAVMMVAAQASAGAQEYRAVGTRLRIVAGAGRTNVSRSIEGAAELLKSAECQKVLTDFTDPAGRTLLANLIALNRRPSQFVTELWFIDSSRERSCTQNDIAAYTTPGSTIIYVCAMRFAAATSSLSGRLGAAVIIHEMLHALGLGENGPNPSPEQITRRVRQRCETN